MKIVKLKKKSGSYRTIYMPSADEKRFVLRSLPGITRRCVETEVPGTMHGFMPGRSPVTNAMRHTGFLWTLSMDLEDFFDSVTPDHMRHVTFFTTDASVIEKFFPDGAARQGIPTSPGISNIAAIPMDRDIAALQVSGRLGQNFVYTRYADDLTFSFNYPSVGVMLLTAIPKIVSAHRFKINERKTRLQSALAGRRVITGVAVDENIHPRRSDKRRLRAVIHAMETGKIGKRGMARLVKMQKEALHRRGKKITFRALLKGQLCGLSEWIKLKTPKPSEKYRYPSVSARQPVHHEQNVAVQQHVVGLFRRLLMLE